MRYENLPPAPHARLDCPLDDPVSGPELSVRTSRALSGAGYKTLREVALAYEKVVLLKGMGMGKKSHDEIRSAVDYALRPSDLFDTPAYRAIALENITTSTMSQLHEVERTLLRVALKGSVTRDTREQLKLKLLDAAARMERLPLLLGE